MLFRIFIICSLLCSCSYNRMLQTDLFFAQSKPNGELIPDSAWQNFTNNHISRVFVNGSTTYKTTGHWLDPVSKKLITEDAYVVSYVYKRSKQLSVQIDSLRAIYVKAFEQQSVLRVDKRIKFHF